MKKFNFLFMLLICLFTYQKHEAQNFTVATCSVGVASNTYGPMNSSTTANSKNRTAFIIPSSQLSALSGGTLTSTYFRRLATSGSLPAGTTFKIYLKLTTAADFGSTSPDWATEIASATLVYDSDPATAVGSTAGFKQFSHSANLTYTAGSNLAVYVEYTQTTAPATSITWDYEYGTTCISTTNSNTTKYLNTTSAFTATLTSTNYRRPVIGFDVSFPAAVSAPACTTLSAPAANATNVSVTPTFTWASVLGQNGATSYVMNLGTTPGGTNVMNGVDVGNVTSYTIPAATPLNFNQQYYVTVLPKNAIGTATGCTETSFTTANIGCPSVTAPAANATGLTTTPTITWTALTGATGYKLSVGTTSGGTDVLNNVDLGNTTSYTFGSALMSSTKYYYTLNAYSATSASASCTVRNFTTACTALSNLPWTENFDAMTTIGNGILPNCWATSGGLSTSYYFTSQNAAAQTYNDPRSAPNYMTIYYPTTAAYLWAPVMTLTAGQSYDFTFYWVGDGTTGWQGDVLVNGSQSATGATTLSSFITPTQTATGGSNSTNYTKVKVTFVPTSTGDYSFGIKTTATTSAPYYMGFDDFSVMLTPSCTEPTALSAASITSSGASVSWTAPATAPANGYEIYYSTSNTVPSSSTTPTMTGITATSQSLSGLSPATTYYVWVRSKCSATQTSLWSNTLSFTTACVAVTTLNENFDTATVGSLPSCWSSIGTTVSYAAIQASSAMSAPNALYIYTSGTSTGMAATPEISNLQSGNYTLKFKGRANFTAGGIVQIGYLTNPSDTSTFVALGSYTSTSTTTVDNYSLDITGVPAGVTRLVLKHTGTPSNSVLIDDLTYQLSPTLATQEVKDNKNSIKVYPNPFSDVLNISDASNVKNILVTDVSGRLLKTIANPSSDLHLGELKQGMYLITLEMKDGSKQTIKTIKK